MIHYTETGCCNLAAAVIVQATKDAVTGGPKIIRYDKHGKPYWNDDERRKMRREAQQWLKGEQCQYYCDCLDFDHNAILDWIDNGCRPLNLKQFMRCANV